MATVPRHEKVPISEGKEAATEDLRGHKPVLREHIDLSVCNHGSGQEHPVLRLIAQLMHALALRRPALFQLVALVADDHVRPVHQQLFFHPPCALVINDNHLQAILRKLRELLLLFRKRPGQHCKGEREIRILGKLVLPDAGNGERANDKEPLDSSVKEHPPGDRDTHEGLSCTHLHQQGGPGRAYRPVDHSEEPEHKLEGFLLVVERLCLHRKFQIRSTHSARPPSRKGAPRPTGASA